MGEYFHAVCHYCESCYTPDAIKLGEIELRKEVRAALGLFMVRHAGHPIELRGDEYNYDHCVSKSQVKRYEEETLEPAWGDDAGEGVTR
jgi:hypothetical protein